MTREVFSCELGGQRFPNGAHIGVDGGLCECVDGKWVRVILAGGV
jgi:hypothetical protein